MNLKAILRRGVSFIIHGIPQIKVTAEITQVSPNSSLLGHNIIVTGGASGLGYAMAKRFLNDGAKILITGRNEGKLLKASKELECQYLCLDITKPESFSEFFREAEIKLGQITGLVNNAGISLHENTFFDVTPETFDKQFQTNLKGTFFLTQTFLNTLIQEKRKGNVIIISSETGETVDNRPYGFTKATLNSMVKGLAYQFRKDNIRINALAPGICATEMTGVDKEGNLYAGDYGSGRYYLPEEIAEIASFLMSPISQCLSGQIITCNNAYTVNPRCR